MWIKLLWAREFLEQISGSKQVKTCFGRMLNINEMKVRNTKSNIHLNVFCSEVMLWFLVTVHEKWYSEFFCNAMILYFFIVGEMTVSTCGKKPIP